MSRCQSRGAAAVWALIVIVVLGVLGGGYWFFKKGGAGLAGLGGSAFDLAKHLPAESRFAMMVKLSGQLDPKAIESDIKDVLAKVPTDKREELSADIQKDLGIPLADLVKFFDGRAAFAGIDTPKPAMLGLIGLRDADGLEKYLASQAPKSEKTETIENVTFRVNAMGQYYGHDSSWLYLGDSSEAAALAIKSASQAEGLDKVQTFVEAKGKVGGDSSLAAFYLDIPSLVKTAQVQKPPGTDEGTFKGLACLGYMVGNYNFKDRESYGFLKVTQDDSQLAQKLLVKGGVSKATLEGIGKELSFCQAIDAEWFFNTVVAIMTLSPETRQQAAMASVGLMAVGNPWTAFDGEIAVGSDFIEQTSPVVTSNFGKARTRGQLTACESNLKNLGTALEMYSTDWSGAYPTNVGLLTPNYLKTIPLCPSAGSDTYSTSYQHTADSYSVACIGQHHGAENLPAYTSAEGLQAPPRGSSEDDEEPEPQPSFVVAAPVKDIGLAHNLLAKGLPDAGAEPKAGEEKVYDIPMADLKMKTDAPARLLFNYGPQGKALADVSKGSVADQPEMRKILEWGGDSLVQADFLDLTPLLEAITKAVPKDDPGAPALLAGMDKLRELGLRGASGLAVRQDGLEYRCYGIGSGPMLGFGAAIMVPNFAKARAQGQLTACKSNQKNIGTALEMYSTDWSGAYPKSMTQLTPNYLRTIPECPAAEKDTYSSTYKLRKSDNGDYEIYEVFCSGPNHVKVGVPADYPQYNGEMGLIEQP